MLIFSKKEYEYNKNICYYEVEEDDGYAKKYFGTIYVNDGDYVFDQSDAEDCPYIYARDTIFELAAFMKSLGDVEYHSKKEEEESMPVMEFKRSMVRGKDYDMLWLIYSNDILYGEIKHYVGVNSDKDDILFRAYERYFDPEMMSEVLAFMNKMRKA